MVKFSKQLEGQLVPEWRAAYVNYKLLKKDLKWIKEHVQEGLRVNDLSSQSFRMTGGRGLTGNSNLNFHRMQESFETFVALTGHALAAHKNNRRSRKDIGIQVEKVDGNPWEIYETSLVDPIESERIFFARLDSQFNKVNHFFRKKEKDFIEHAEILEKQMQALVEMQRTLNEELLHQPLEPTASPDLEAGVGSFNRMEREGIDDDAMTRRDGGATVAPDTDEIGGETSEITGSQDGLSHQNPKSISPQLTMKMRIPMTTPGTTISVLSQSLWEDVVKQMNKNSNSPGDQQKDKGGDDVTVTKRKIQLADKMLRAAFVEYYRGLALLKSYSSLNMVAFAKILKKYDKVSGQRVSATYVKAVETSYFNTSDRVIQLMEKVEALFTKHFANYNRRKAMMSLRPRQKKASHSITFALGLFSGGSLALLAVFSVLVHNLLSNSSVHQSGDRAYLETVFPIFSMIALILLHIYMYGVDLYYWRRKRINYPFIFEFQPGTELRYREVLMITTILTTLLMGTMVGTLTLHSTTLSPYVDFIPFALVLALVVLLIFPFNTFYQSSRVFFLNSMLHIVGSPLYKVVLADFFLADQLTSQVPMLRNLQFVLCYYLGGFFRTGTADKCFGNNSYKGLTYLISLLPYWWRLMQCGRRFIDEADNAHIANGGKYLSALIAVAIRIQYGRVSSNAWMGLHIVSSTVATVYQLYWDVVVDWGLLRKDSTNPWLRDRLIMPKKRYVYFVAMGLNTLLRLAWLQSVTRFKFVGLDQQVTDFVFASLEIIRRGHWNFYRLENEHLNNVGKFRATKTVPLPFEDPTTEEED